MTPEQSQSPLDWILESLFPKEKAVDPAYAAAEADLDAYVELRLDGKDADARYPHVRPALEQFADLREEYESLLSLLADARAGLLVEPPEDLELDLSFLARERSLWEWVESGEKRVARLLHEIHVRVGQAVSSFGQLPPMLAPQLVAVSVRGDEQATAEALDIAAEQTGGPPEQAISLRLQLGPAQQGQAIVSLRVAVANDTPSARRARVTLLGDIGQMLISAHVDGAGWVTFRDVDPGRYTIRVVHDSGIWELPLLVEPQAAGE